MKLNAVGDMPLTPPYDEDEALTAPIEEKDIQQQDNEDNDDMPLDTWLQFKMEEAKRREEFERESAEVLMNTSPASIVQGKTEKKKKKWSLIPSDDESSSPVKEENDKELSDHEEDDDEHDDDAIIVTQGKRISLKDTCVIATLKRRSRLMNLHKEAGASVEAKDDGLPSQEDDEMKVDEFGMRIEGAGKVLPVDEAEVAMNEDRTVSGTASQRRQRGDWLTRNH